MQKYLLIENPGICPVEGFTVAGTSMKTSEIDDFNLFGYIGLFGSGAKNSLALLERKGLSARIFSSTTGLKFFTKQQEVTDGLTVKTIHLMHVKYSGERTATEKLGFDRDFGKADWQTVDLALREFVSNAIDHTCKFNYYNAVDTLRSRYPQKAGEPWKQYQERLSDYLTKRFADSNPWDGVVIEQVDENQIRAKEGYTRIFVPVNEDVFNFYANKEKWFLHFSEPESLRKNVLTKNDRNIEYIDRATIYRRGVRVREIENSNLPSMFDYNFKNLRLDESRKIDDHQALAAAGFALARAETPHIKKFLFSLKDKSDVYWEHTIQESQLTEQSNDKIIETWKKAFQETFPSNYVAATENASDLVVKKGYVAVKMPESIFSAMHTFGVRNFLTVLTKDELEGREVVDPHPVMLEGLKYIFEMTKKFHMHNNKEVLPAIKGFHQTMQGETVLHGFWDASQKCIYLNMADYPVNAKTYFDLSSDTQQTMIEELAHWISGATDSSRGFQDWCFGFLAKFMNERNEQGESKEKKRARK